MKKLIKDVLMIIILLAIFSAVFLYWGNLKSVNFCDEIYSYILSNSNNEFLTLQLEGGRWYEKGEIQDILSANDGFQFKQVMMNNAGDVHPPMYYFVFHIISVLNAGSVSKWIGLAANWLFAAISLIFVYILIKTITKSRVWSFVACLVCITSPAVISNNMFMRMYCMFSMWTVIFTYISYCLYTREKLRIKDAGLYAALSATTFFGFLTQYYFAVFCVIFTCFYCIGKLVSKQWKEVIAYVGRLCVSVVVATVFWPTWINHMFSGYLGVNVKKNAFDFSRIFVSIRDGIKHIFTLMYNRLGLVIGLALVVLIIVMIVKKIKEVRYVIGLLGTAVLYSIAIMHLTPVHLLNYRYFFPAVLIAYLALFLATYYAAHSFLDKKSIYVSGLLVLLAVLNFARPTYDKDAIQFVDYSGDYARSMEALEEIKAIPWVYYGYENSTMTELMYDSVMADRFVMVNATAPFADQEFLNSDGEFILFMGDRNAYFNETAFASLREWFTGGLKYEKLFEKGNMTVYKVQHKAYN